MRSLPAPVRMVVTRAFNPLLALPILVILHLHDLAGRAPLALVVVCVLAYGVLEQPSLQHWLATRFDGRWPSFGVSLHVLVASLTAYLVGWGPLLSIVFALTVIQHFHAAGSRVWRPAVVWMLVAVGAGQAGIALGWVYSYLPGREAQAAGLLGAMVTGFFIRSLGRTTERSEQAERSLRGSEVRFRALVQDSTDVISVLDRDLRMSYVSPAIEQVTGMSPEDFASHGYRELIHPDDLAAADLLVGQAMEDPDGRHQAELRIRHADGGWRWVEINLRNLLGSEAVGGLVSTFRDVTERRAVQERLAYDAHHDPLTGLMNRGAFLNRLQEEFADRGAVRPTAVLFVDLDGFKKVNDTHGHRYGDAVLLAVAEVLRRNVLGSDTVGRLGGDEFGIVLGEVDSPADAAAVAERVLADLRRRPIVVDGLELYARASIGVAVDGPDCPDAADLLHRADMAMYRAKARGDHGAEVYAGGLEDDAVQRELHGSPASQ